MLFFLLLFPLFFIEEDVLEHGFEYDGGDADGDVPILAEGDFAGLFRNDHDDGVGEDGGADGGAVAQAEVGRDVLAVGNGQDAARRHNAVVLDNQRAIVQRAVLEEDVLNQLARDDGIEALAGGDGLVQGRVFLENNERTGLGVRHAPAGPNHEVDFGIVDLKAALLLVKTPAEQFNQARVAEQKEEFADFRLENHNQRNHTHANHLAENGTHQIQMGCTQQFPSQKQDDNRPENADGRRTPQQFEQLVQDDGKYQNVNYIRNSK